MIQEIKNFVEHISQNDEEVFSRNLKLKEGIYVLLDIQKQKDEYVLVNESEIFETKKDIFVFNGKNETENQILYKKFLSLQINSTVVGNGKNKSLNSSSGIFMFTANPFAIALKKERYNLKIQDSIIAYFKAAQNYVEEQKHIDWLDAFKGFCESKLLQLIPQITEFEELNKKQLIYFFLKEPTLNDFSMVHQAYLSEKVFNKDKFNVKIEDTTFGISDNLSGFNDKKMFLKHYTSPLEYNYRIEGDVAMQLWRFFELQKNKQIPNPIPIFIDKQELNEKMISIFSEDNKIGHAALIKSILKEATTQSLQNYYLIYFGGTKGSRIADIDFVSQFKYEEKDAEIIEIFPLGGKQSSKKIEHVFDLENHVFNRIFNGQLKTDTWLKYFGELEYNPKYMTDTVYNQLLRYRQAIYNFIYKSQRQAITAIMFDDMMQKGILDDIRNDEYKDKKHSHEYAIKEKLNIWFSLYNFFINTNLEPRENMKNESQNSFTKLKELVSIDSTEKISNDKDFAFLVGQTIHILLDKSKADNKTHSLLEPFLQKTDVNQLKLAIARTFNNYKHEIPFYWKGFDRMMNEVMEYTPTETNMKNLLPLILAGYFSKSIFSKDKDNTESN